MATDPSRSWAFEFEAPAGARILGGSFIGIEAGFGDPAVEFDDIMWWDMDNRRWIPSETFPWGKRNPKRDFASSSSAPCRSFKAFRRHLRKHPELAGRRVRLVSRFVGCDVWAIPAIAMEARQGGDAQQAPSRSDDSAGRKASPQPTPDNPLNQEKA